MYRSHLRKFYGSIFQAGLLDIVNKSNFFRLVTIEMVWFDEQAIDYRICVFGLQLFSEASYSYPPHTLHRLIVITYVAIWRLELRRCNSNKQGQFARESSLKGMEKVNMSGVYLCKDGALQNLIDRVQAVENCALLLKKKCFSLQKEVAGCVVVCLELKLTAKFISISSGSPLKEQY